MVSKVKDQEVAINRDPHAIASVGIHPLTFLVITMRMMLMMTTRRRQRTLMTILMTMMVIDNTLMTMMTWRMMITMVMVRKGI
jgi:hypothetical protein